jgi:sugar lactone lactonase YvrE
MPVRSLLFGIVALSCSALAQPAALRVAQGLTTPESVLYDAERDTYLVSNINGGAPVAQDNDGYVTELSPDGKVVAAKLIAGGVKGVTLNAPKGLALVKGVLYVADIDTVRLFDRKTGAPKGEVKVPGATFLNDVAAGDDGRVYVTDSGFNATFEGTGTDALYVIVPGATPTLQALVKDPALNHPNGVWVTAEAIYVVSFGAPELRKFTLAGKPQGVPTVLPKGSLDGIIGVGDELIISSWEAEALYRGTFGGPFRLLQGGLKAPADLGFDRKRRRVLVARFQDNAIEAWNLK